MSERMFPIMVGQGIGQTAYVPWSLVAPFEARAQRNHSQTLERLAQRGGLGPDELAHAIKDEGLWDTKRTDIEAWRVIWSIPQANASADEIKSLSARLEAAEKWVADLQSGMYINYVYCGHRYGPNDGAPVSMATVLYEHIKVCPKHPLSAAQSRIEKLEAELAAVRGKALEEAAKIAEGWRGPAYEELGMMRHRTASNIAEAIRALLPSNPDNAQ